MHDPVSAVIKITQNSLSMLQLGLILIYISERLQTCVGLWSVCKSSLFSSLNRQICLNALEGEKSYSGLLKGTW